MQKLLYFLCFGFCMSGFAQEAKLIIPVGHKGGMITSLKFSPNGKFLFTHSGTDETTYLWEIATERLIRKLRTGVSDFIQFSPNGKYIAIQVDKNAEIQETASGNVIKRIETEFLIRSDNSPIFSPDSRYCVIENDGTINIIEISTGNVIREIANAAGMSPHFSPDGKYIVTYSPDATSVKIWEAPTGKLIYDIKGDFFVKVWFSPSGKYLVTANYQRNDNSHVRILEFDSGKQVQDFESKGAIHRVCFYPNESGIVVEKDIETFIKFNSTGQSVALTDASLGYSDLGDAPVQNVEIRNNILVGLSAGGYLIYIVDLKKNVGMRLPYPKSKSIVAAELSPDGKHVAISRSDDVTEILETETGNPVSRFVGNVNSATYAEFSPNDKYIVTSAGDIGAGDSIVRIWDTGTGTLVKTLEHAKSSKVRSSHFSHGGEYIVTVSNETVKLWETSTWKLVGDLVFPNAVLLHSAELSPNTKNLATAAYDEKGSVVNIWDVSSKRIIKNLRLSHYHKNDVQRVGSLLSISAHYSHDGEYLIAASRNDTVKIWNTSTGGLIKNIIHTNGAESAEFSSDKKYIITAGQSAKIWEFPSCRFVYDIRTDGQATMTTSPKFSADGKYIVTASSDKKIKIWETATGNLVKTLMGHTNDVNSVSFSKDGKYIVSTSQDLSSKLWNMESGLEVLSWYSVGHTDWVVTSPSGLFDATSGAIDKLYYVQELNTIDLSQLKERYYEPNLWGRVRHGEKNRSTESINSSSIELAPDIQVNPVDEKGYLLIELTNKGGGIGDVAIYIQGKEVVKDARDKNADPDAASLKINYYVSNHKNLINGTNYIGVKAWNKNHWVESRGTIISYEKGETEKNYEPSVHILVCGISDYAGNADIDLTYAAKDADDVGNALKLGAAKLFGVQKSNVYNLTTTMPKEFWPTKINIVNTFMKISATAHPMDVIVVYLSGHGINLGGEKGDWYYLTQEANTSSTMAYNDPSIRQSSTLSSTELVELFNTVPAAKQVLMIDACASGRVVDNLVAKKDIPSSTLRSLDRMKDRTGMHIITGCTADAVSYEANRYGQGVLTYSLLEGIRGAALRDDEFVDVNRLFQYAKERVPSLAEDIGGIQTPMVFSPNGSQSFDIGQLTITEKRQIPISKVRLVYIQSNFQDEDEMSDVIGLGKKVDQLLSESSARGADAPIVFVPVREYPDGCQFVGRYKKMNGKIILKLRKKCEGKDLIMEITGTDLNDLSNKVIQAVN